MVSARLGELKEKLHVSTAECSQLQDQVNKSNQVMEQAETKVSIWLTVVSWAQFRARLLIKIMPLQYSRTCLERPPLWPQKCGLSSQVVSDDRFSCIDMLVLLPKLGGLSKTSGLSWQWSLKTGFTVLDLIGHEFPRHWMGHGRHVSKLHTMLLYPHAAFLCLMANQPGCWITTPHKYNTAFVNCRTCKIFHPLHCVIQWSLWIKTTCSANKIWSYVEGGLKNRSIFILKVRLVSQKSCLKMEEIVK